MIQALLMFATMGLPTASSDQAKPLAGSAAVMGTPAKIGPYQFTLTGASFATRVVHSEDTAIADKDKKFLVLNYTVQNPGKEELSYDWASIRFTVVSADNANHENAQIALNPEKLTPLELKIKPAQKVPGMTYVEVPASDPIPKLMVLAENAPVLRYDLKGKVAKFTGMFAGADGVTATEKGSTKLGEKAELGHFDFAVEKVEEGSQAIGDTEPGEDQKLVVVTVAFTNAGKVDRSLDWNTYELSMKDTNGEPVEYKQALVRAVGTAAVNDNIKPGETVRGRLLFAAAKGAKPANVTFAWGEGRSVEVSLK